MQGQPLAADAGMDDVMLNGTAVSSKQRPGTKVNIKSNARSEAAWLVPCR